MIETTIEMAIARLEAYKSRYSTGLRLPEGTADSMTMYEALNMAIETLKEKQERDKTRAYRAVKLNDYISRFAYIIEGTLEGGKSKKHVACIDYHICSATPHLSPIDVLKAYPDKVLFVTASSKSKLREKAIEAIEEMDAETNNKMPATWKEIDLFQEGKK